MIRMKIFIWYDFDLSKIVRYKLTFFPSAKIMRTGPKLHFSSTCREYDPVTCTIDDSSTLAIIFASQFCISNRIIGLKNVSSAR